MRVIQTCMVLSFTIFVLALSATFSFADEPGDAGTQCSQGHTLSCITLGIEAEKQKDQDTALAYYRMACKGHPTTNLRACTPLLALSRAMRVLNKEAEFLEDRCEKEGSDVCFYLGKEYYRIKEFKRAVKHLEPLCKESFQPADKRDIGPCFHLARSFHSMNDYRNARKYYRLDCGDKIERVHPSCENLRNINLIFALTPERVGPKPFLVNTSELLFLVLCGLPGIGVLIWFFGRPGGLWFLKWGGPLAFIGSSITWGFFVERPDVIVGDQILLVLVLTTMTGLTFFSWQAQPETMKKVESSPSS
ncbi:MAG: tetratricopeptide repeat protein [Candidatus Nitronauta litoralis]|uniref:Tetratricopeptide repeat protein n=1 Tax=Candidatus Nitronauta litoralis TaxID=2705533 RepID=A0A7T0BT22_9BACT|nr:MAG: tetratricopeptide repeat protein [Candidatus Nitronauta litoralis]